MSSRVTVLVSAGRHPLTGRPRRAPLDARALEVGLGLAAAGNDLRVLHAGDPHEPSLRHYLGSGPRRIDVVTVASDEDIVAALGATLRADRCDLILTGDMSDGEASGLVPYQVARMLGLPILSGIAAISFEAGGAINAHQAFERGQRHRLRARPPLVATIGPAAPAPRPYAFGRAREGAIVAFPNPAPRPASPDHGSHAPMRRRAKRIGAGVDPHASPEERLRAVTEMAKGGGQIVFCATPDQAAQKLLEFLAEQGFDVPRQSYFTEENDR